MSQRLRSLLVVLVGGAVLAFAADALVRAPGFLIPKDFLEYWSAGRVNLRAGNPYDPDQLLAEQKLADENRTEAVMMWNPPPALAVYMPLGAIAPRWATLLWVALQFAAVFVACDLLWRTYHGAGQRWFAALVALAFVGTWWLVTYGQNTGLMLLGLAGFLHFRQKDRPLAAGACAALTALKPHLLAVFGVLLVADAVTRRGAKALAAGAGVLALALVVAVVANPAVLAQFVDGVRHPKPGAKALWEWWLPVPSFWLRKWLALDQFWVQFVPCMIACAGFLLYRLWKQEGVVGGTRGGFPLPKGSTWDWSRALPLVVAVSVIATPYGGWIFDLPVLLVPVVWAAARLVSAGRVELALGFVVAQAAITAASFALPDVLARPVGLHEHWWVAPAALALCLSAVAVRPRS